MAIFTDADIQARALVLQQQAQAKAAQQQAEQQRQLAEQQAAAQAAERNRSRTVGEVAGDVGAGLLQSAMNVGGAAYGAANMASLGGLDRLTGMSQNFQQANQIAEGWKSAPLQARQQDVQAAFDQGIGAGVGKLATTPSVLGDYAVQSLGYLLPGAALSRVGAASGAARALAAGPALPETIAAAAQQGAVRANLATHAAQTAGYMNVDSINAARDAGLSEGEQQTRGLIGGGIGAVVGPALSKLTGAAGLEARAAQIGMGTAVPGAATGVLQKAGMVAAGVGQEAVEEGSQETYEQMVRNWAGNKELMQGTGQNAATGAVLGGLFGGVLASTHLRSPSPARTQLDAAKAEVTDTLAADTGESPLRPSFIDSLSAKPVLNPFTIDSKLATPPVLDTAALDARAAEPAIAVGSTGEALQPQTDLLGDTTYPRAYNAPAAEQPSAAPVSRRQMGLDLAAPQAPISVDPAGTAIAAGADVPPLTAVAQAQTLPNTVAQQVEQQRATLLADEKAHRDAVRSTLEQATGEKLGGQEVVKLAATLRNEGIAPTDSAFAPRVAELVNARLAENPNSRSKALGVLSNTFATEQAPTVESVAQTAAEPAVPVRAAADYIAQLDTAQQTATNDAELETNVRGAIDAVRADPGYAALPDADWHAAEARIATLSNDVFGSKFELSERRRAAKAVSTALFAKGVITADSNVGRVHGFDTIAELAAAVGFPIPANAKGMYHNGNVYLVRENLASAKDLAYTLAHEVGHGGLDQLLGESLTASTNRLWANPAMRQRIKAKQGELGEGTTRATAAEEVLADMLASGERLNKDVWAKLRAGVREFFARVFGLRGVTISNAEVDGLLSDVARVIRGAPAAQVRAEMVNPTLWLTDPVAAMNADPKFAKVKTDLDQTLADAAQESGGTVTSFNHFTKAAVEAGGDALASLKQALKLGKVSDVWTHYMLHLDHMVALHDKKLGGRISPIAKLKELQQAMFNRTLAENKARTFQPGKGKAETLAAASITSTTETWDVFRRANPARGELLDYVQNESTFYKLFPTLPWDQQSKVDYATEGYTMGQRKAAYEAVRKAYDRMGETAQGLYKQSQATYADLDQLRWQTLLDEVDRQGKLVDEVVTDKAGHQQTVERIKGVLHNAMHTSKAGSYSPLQRYGKYNATVRDAQGNTVFFAGYDTLAEAEAARDTVMEARKAAGETGLIGNASMTDDNSWSSVGVSAGTIEQLRRDAEAVIPPTLDPETRQMVLSTLTSGLTEAYLKALPTKSFMKHALGRKNIAGYDGDSLRGFANYTLRAARNIASIKYDGQIDSALTQLQQYVKDVETGKYMADGQDRTNTAQMRDIAAAVREQHLAAANFQANGFVKGATGASFIYMMTSPSQMFMNATQTLLVTLPRMMARYSAKVGEARTVKELTRAMADYAKSRGDLLGEHSVLRKTDASPADKLALAALERIREDGPLDQSQAHDAAGIAAGEAGALAPYWNKVMKWVSFAMHKSETFNRQVTALAAARLDEAGRTPPAEGSAEYTQRREALVESGKYWIGTTHFNYDKYNKPVALNTNTGMLLGQFRQYQIHMLSLMAKDIRDAELGKLATNRAPIDKEEAAIARRTLSYMLGTQLAFTGVAGTVLAPVAFAIADAFRALDDDEELVDSKTEALAMMPSVAAYGVLGLFTDTGRISAGSALPILGQRDYAPIGGKASDTLTYYVTQNLGPTFGLARNVVTGVADAVNGDFYKASQNLLPKPAADAVKALEEGTKGARDARDVLYGQPSIWSAVNQLVGLKSAERRDMELPRNAAYQINQRAFQFKEQAKMRVALAQATGDMELYRDTLDAVNRFNAQYPDYRVKPAELVSAARSRMRAQGVAEATGVVSSRLPGPTLDPYLGR